MMRIDLENMLRQAGIAADHGDEIHGSGYAFSLRQLGEHLRELRDRHAAGDTGVVAEFFDLYVLHDKEPAKP
jgi:hypothetical protein